MLVGGASVPSSSDSNAAHSAIEERLTSFTESSSVTVPQLYPSLPIFDDLIELEHSCASNSEACLQFFTEESENHSDGLPFQHSAPIIRRRQFYPTAGGGFGYIWECDLISGGRSRMVAVKAVRTDTCEVENLRSRRKKLRRELRVWRGLRHKNIVPLLGVVSGFGPLLSMVSPWFPNGSLSHYLAYHPALSVPEKHKLLKDIAMGLHYLHGQGVVHGDLHTKNVLVGDDGTACLTDFGLSLIKDFVGTSYLKSHVYGNIRFTDPALVQRANYEQDAVLYPTEPCDVYSFGGLVLHVLSGKRPHEGTPDAAIVAMALRGEQPQIPTVDEHITKWHRSVIQMCWNRKESRRPSAGDLVRMFEL